MKRKFVFDTKEILKLVKKAEAEASKRKAKNRRKMPKIRDKEEEGIEDNIYESRSDCIPLLVLFRFRYNDVTLSWMQKLIVKLRISSLPLHRTH